MKSDEEFIAGIYKKAEERKIEEAKAAQRAEHVGGLHHFHVWHGVAAAACVCLIISGAVYAGRPGQTPSGASNGTYSEQENAEAAPGVGIMPASEDGIMALSAEASIQEEMQGRGRSMEPAGYEMSEMPEGKLTGGAYTGALLALKGKIFSLPKNGADAQETGGN